jgi:hypothetical protein
VIHPPHPVRSGLFKIPIETEGRLPLLPELLQTLGLEPGDMVGLKSFGDYLTIKFYREILTYRWEFAPQARWTFTKEFLSLPLTVIEEGGVIAIAPDLLPLHPGDRAHLSVSAAAAGYLWPSVLLSRGTNDQPKETA